MVRSCQSARRPGAAASVVSAALGLSARDVAHACTVCFSDSEQSGGIAAGIVLLLVLVFVIQVAAGAFIWRLWKTRESRTDWRRRVSQTELDSGAAR